MQMYPSYINLILYYARYENPLKTNHVNWPKNVALNPGERDCYIDCLKKKRVYIVNYVIYIPKYEKLNPQNIHI